MNNQTYKVSIDVDLEEGTPQEFYDMFIDTGVTYQQVENGPNGHEQFELTGTYDNLRDWLMSRWNETENYLIEFGNPIGE